MAAFFNDKTHPLLIALYEGNVERIYELMPQTPLEEKHKFEIEHEPTSSRIPCWGNAVEFIAHLIGQDAPISSEQITAWKKSLNALMEYNEVTVGQKLLQSAVRMMENRRVSAKDATDVLKILDNNMANWLSCIFEHKKDSYLDAVAHHLPSALPKLRNSQFVIRKLGMGSAIDIATRIPETPEWTSNNGYSPWFAWFPVKINGQRKFLETIERKRNMDAGMDLDKLYSYRALPETKLSKSPINPLRPRRTWG